MKKSAFTAKNFMMVGLTISAIILSAAFFISSIGSVSADDRLPDYLTQKQVSVYKESGRYSVQFQTEKTGSQHWLYLIVMDTTTGNSKFYYTSAGSNGKGWQVGARKFQLPSKPL